MKTAHILTFSIVFIISGIVLFNNLSANNSVSSVSNSNPVKIPVSVSSTEVPQPTPTESSPSVNPTLTANIFPTATQSPPIPTPTVSKSISKVQVIKATYGPPFGFSPAELTVKAGIPVRLEVYASENGRGCMGSIMLPELLPNNIQGFTKGQTNIFEFTAQTPGTYSITCAMGIPHGNIIVE